MTRCSGALALAAAIIVASCGGAAPEAGSSSPAAYPSPNPEDVQGVHAGGAPTAATAATEYAKPPSAQKANALAQFNDAEGQVQSSLSDCATACRALASMENAANHICELDQGGGDCSSARQRVNAARDRVLRACGACH